MTGVERAITFDCAGESLVGVLAQPPADTQCSDIGVLIVVGGPQYRAGSHRQYVRLARLLAADGHVVLRFDVRGMGDSTGAPRSFEALDEDIAAARKALLHAAPQVRRLVLWGLCDGASAALLYCARRRPQDIAGLCLVNPWLRSVETRARTQFRVYYRQRLLEREFWLKLASGGIALRALRELTANLRAAFARDGPSRRADAADAPGDFRRQMALGWQRFNGAILLVLCSADFTAREFLDGSSTLPEWSGALSRSGVTRLDVPDSDHTYSTAAAREIVETGARRWLHGLYSASR
jgi:exosortase A-associated hydrolase 1